jgi:tripartite ATP-independent transporter DctP family solute receptor
VDHEQEEVWPSDGHFWEELMNYRRLLKYSVASIVLACAAPQAWAQGKQVTITHSSATNSHWGVAALEFEKVVEALSKNKYNVVVQRLDNEREAVESVQLGSQECALGSTGPVGNFVPDIRVLDVPFLFRDYAHARGVLDSEVGDKLLEKFKARGMIGMVWMENGFRHLTTGKKEVQSPSDVRGMKIRTMENQVHMEAWKAAGVLPTPMAFSELPSALQQGTVDGQENPIPVILAGNFDQLQKYLYLTSHVYSPGVLVCGLDFWNGLSAEDKKIFQDAAKASVKANRSRVEEDERSGVQELRRRGMEVREVTNREAYQEAMKTAVANFEKQFGADVLKTLREWRPK